MSFEEFLSFYREEERKGHIKTSKPLSDIDVAIYWAMCEIVDERGIDEPISAIELAIRLPQYIIDKIESEVEE